MRVVLMCLATLGATPAEARVCMPEVIVARSSTGLGMNAADREKRATKSAIDKWRNLARDRHGLLYRPWSFARDRTITCRGTQTTSTCEVSALPCRISVF